MKDTDWEIIAELHKLPNITKVANKLYMTQPSLTKRLQSIEHEFHVQLVIRTKHGVEFTPEGELLAQKAKKYMEFLRLTRQEMKALRENAKQSVTIGSSYSYQLVYLNDILIAYFGAQPNLSYEVDNGASNVIFRKVCDKDIDLGFIQGDYEGPVQQVLLGTNKGYVFSKQPINMKDLPKLPRIMYPSNDRAKEVLDNWWDTNYKSEQMIGMSVKYIDFAWKLAESGYGYFLGFIPEKIIKHLKLVRQPILDATGKQLERHTWLVYRKETLNNKVVRDFIEYVTKEYAVKQQTTRF
jgi:DNA-binding transcriptional LysR family regulator